MRNRQVVTTSRFLDSLFVAVINGYQKKISPRKGWRCSYGVLHGGTGCSGYVKNAIQQHGWPAAWPLARNRFHECKLASQQLRAQNIALPMAFAADSRSRRQRRINEAIDSCDCCCAFDCCPSSVADSVSDHSCSCSPCD